MAKRTLQTATPDLVAEAEDGVATLTMNRPDRRNALSGAMLAAMATTLEACETDPEIGCIVLTGGGGAFCAGGASTRCRSRPSHRCPAPRPGPDCRSPSLAICESPRRTR